MGLFSRRSAPAPDPAALALRAVEVTPLACGESRLIALTAPLPAGNAFFAEHRADGRYGVFSERPRSHDDPVRERYEEELLGTFTELSSLLRAVAAMLGCPVHWADDDLRRAFEAEAAGADAPPR